MHYCSYLCRKAGRIARQHTVIDVAEIGGTSIINFDAQTPSGFHKCARSEYIPHCVTSIDPGNYRGITLLSVVGKVFCKVVNNRLVQYLDCGGKLHEGQAGFRVGRSCMA